MGFQNLEWLSLRLRDTLVLSTISRLLSRYSGKRSWREGEMFGSLGNTTELEKFLPLARIETVMI